MKRIVIIKGQSQYDALRVFADQLARGLEERCVEPIILDLNLGQNEIINVVSQCVNTGVDGILAFNGVGVDLTINGQCISDFLGTAFYAFLVDHPMYHMARISTAVKDMRVITIDYDHARFVKEYVPQVREVYMIPHGGMSGGGIKPYDERSIDVLFAGSYSKPEYVMERIMGLAQSVRDLALGVIDMMLKDGRLTEENAIKEYLRQKGLGEMLDTVPDWMRNITDIDTYVRAYRRDALIRNLVLGGVKVVVRGNGWEQFECHNRENLIVGPPVSYEENLMLMGDSKIVLNIMPEFKRGSHERVFCAMLNKAVCVSDRSSYLEAHFTHGKDIIYYDIDSMEALPQLVQEVLQDVEGAARMVDLGYEKAVTEHSWSNRAARIVEVI